MSQEANLCLSAHDELYIIDLEKVLYMKADDHYTNVYLATGAHFLVPFGLGQIETAINNRPDASPHLLRLGRKYIVNARRIFRVNTVKELLYLTDDEGNNVSLHINKPVLRSLINQMKANAQAPLSAAPH